MRELSSSGQKAIHDIAERSGFSPGAVKSMFDAVIHGQGGMAQFDHPEFGGHGQWMRGGMTMVSDMFNEQLKGRVAELCLALAKLAVSQPALVQAGSFQSQSQGAPIGQRSSARGYENNAQSQKSADFKELASLFVPGVAQDWWPSALRQPNSTGAQNGVRYAYFALARRLAVALGGQVTVYDTLDHQIGGFSQQQSGTGSVSFTSQHGLIDLASLPVVSGEGTPRKSPSQASQPAQVPQGDTSDIVGTIEKLAALQAKGILSAEEFSAKKAELLARL